MKFILTVLLVTLLVSCKLKDEVVNPTISSRNYYLGFTTFSYDVTSESQDYTYSKIKTDADLITFQFNDGVPWEESLFGLTYHSNILNDWQLKKSNIPSGHKVLVSVTPINSSFTSLALYKKESGNKPLGIPWDSYRLNHTSVKAAYFNYCKRIIDYFNPSYFVFATRVNLLINSDPTLGLWNAFLDLQIYVYTELKKYYPSLSIMVSFSAIDLIQGYTAANNTSQNQGLIDAMKYSDQLAVALYPFLSNYRTESIPANFFDNIFSLSLKPVCITETGFPAQVISYNNGSIVLNGSEQKQKDFYEKIFSSADKYKPTFINNLIVRDIDKYWQANGSMDNESKAFRDLGLYDENGISRSALEVWKNKFKMAYSK